MRRFGQYIIEGAPEGDKPDEVKPVKPGDPDYNLVMKMRAKYGIDPTGGKLDKKAIDQQALRKGTIKALGSKRFKRDMQDHTIADERLRRIDEVIQVNEYVQAAIAAGRVLLPTIGRSLAGIGSSIARSAVGRGATSLGSSLGRAGGTVKTAVKKAVMPVKPGKNSTMGLAKKFTGQQIARLPKGSVQQQLAARVASSGFKVAQSTPVQFAVQKPILTGAILSAGQRVKGGVSNRTQRGPEYR